LLTNIQHEDDMPDAPRVRITNGNGHTNGNGNGTHANGHAPSIAGLQAEIAGIHRKQRQLTAERETHALAAVGGDTDAATRIAAIDQERTQLSLRSETLQAAVRALHAQERETDWKRWLPNAQRIYRGEIGTQLDLWPDRLNRLLIGRQSQDVRELRLALQEFDALRRTSARIAAERALPDHVGRTFRDAGDHRPRQHAGQAAQERNRLVGLLAEALLADMPALPRFSQALVDALHEARNRLDALAHVPGEARPPPRARDPRLWGGQP
jgi:hypothetical protein